MTSKLPDPIPTTNEGAALLEVLKAVRKSGTDLAAVVSGISLGADHSIFTAADHDLSAWSYDGFFASGTSAAVSGTLYVSKSKAAMVNPIVSIDPQASAAGSGHTLVKAAVFDAAGVRLGVTADLSGSFTTGAMALTAPTRALIMGEVLYFGFIAVSTAPPTLRIPSASGVPQNYNLTASGGFRGGTIAAQSDMPTSLTLSSVVGSTPRWFAGKHA